MSERDGVKVFRFDADSWVCVHCRPNSDVVQVTSNIADEASAGMYSDAILQSGGVVLRICSAGVLVAALELIKSKPTAPLPALGEVSRLREENGRLKSDMRDCLDVLQMCLSDKNMNVSTHGGIVGCINVIQQALAHDASKE